jgi:hypothetical protein
VNRPAIVIALVAAFLIGTSVGLMSGIFFTLQVHRPPAPFFDGRGRGMGGPGVFERVGREVGRRVVRNVVAMKRLREALDLSDEQAARIQPLIEQTHAAMGAERESLRVRIERVLTPEQRERWRRLEASRGVPGETRGPRGRANRALPGPEGDQR